MRVFIFGFLISVWVPFCVDAHENSSWQLEGTRVGHLNIRHSPVHRVPCHVHIYEDADGTRRRYEWDWQPSDGPLGAEIPITAPVVDPEPVIPDPIIEPDPVIPDPITEIEDVQEKTPNHPSPPGISVETQPSSQEEVSPAVETREPPEPIAPKPVIHDIVLTEIMFHDDGMQDTSQWFELYNRGSEVSIVDWSIVFSTHSKSTSGRGGEPELVFGDHVIARGETLIIALKQVPAWGRNIDNYAVYPLQNLKNKWVLFDQKGRRIYERRGYWGYGWNLKLGGSRHSVNLIPTVAASTSHFYGRHSDHGTPGWHEDVVPQAPAFLRKKTVLWGELKR